MFRLAIVDTDRTPMWSLPGTNIYLNFNNPEIEVDETKLTDAQKKTIELEVKRRAISTSVPITLTFKSETKESASISKQPQEVKKVFTPEDFIKQKLEKVKSLLSTKLSVLKKTIKTESISDLRLLLEEERKGKNRKTVIQTIELAISKYQTQVFNSVSKELGDVSTQDLKSFEKMSYGLNLDNIEDIVESEVEEIPIKLGAGK